LFSVMELPDLPLPYRYENSPLHFFIFVVAGGAVAAAGYAVLSVVVALFLSLTTGGILSETWSAVAHAPSPVLEPLVAEPFYAVAVILVVYFGFVLRRREWWDGEYVHEGRDKWKLLALSTVVGGAGALYLVFIRRGVAPGSFVVAYLPYGVGLIGFSHYLGETVLDDVANHGAELDDVSREILHFQGQAFVLVSLCAVFVGLPFGHGVGDAAVVSPFGFGALYVSYRQFSAKSRGDTSDSNTEAEIEDERDEGGAGKGVNERRTRVENTEDEGRMKPTENIDKIEALLESDDATRRRRGLKALYVVAVQEPATASDFVPALVGIVEDDHNQLRGDAAEILAEIAKSEPEKVRGATDALGSLLREKYPPAQRKALLALAEVAEGHPTDISPLADDILLLTENPDNRIQRNAFRALRALGMDGETIRERKEDTHKDPLDNTARINKDAKRRKRHSSDDDPDSKYLEPPPDTDFGDVGGMEDLLQELERRVVRPLEKPELYEEHGASVVNGVLFHGPPGTGKTHIAEALAGELSYNFIEVHSSDVLSKYIGESANLVEEMFDVALDNQPCIVFFDEIDAIASKRTGGPKQNQSQRQMVSELLRQLTRIQGERVVVIGATNILEEVDDAVKRRKRFDMLFEVPLPDTEARKEIAKVHLRDSPHDKDAIDWERFAELTQGYAAGDVETVVNHAAMKAAEEAHRDGQDVVPISRRHLEESIEEVEPSSKDTAGAADHLREPPEKDFGDVGGMGGLKQELRELIIEPLENPEMYEEFGLTTVNGVLAHGPPGTGKTYIAEALAGELGYRFVVVKPDDIVSKWAGEAPNKLAEVFDVAVQNQPCLVLMDEIDAVASERGGSGETRTERQTVNQLLTELERIDNEDVIVLATTNAYDDLDPAVVRSGRFDRKIEFPRPDAEARVEILKVHLREPPVADGIDWDRVAEVTEGLVASDLDVVAENAARKAVEESKEEGDVVPVDQEHLEEGIEEVEPTLLKWSQA